MNTISGKKPSPPTERLVYRHKDIVAALPNVQWIDACVCMMDDTYLQPYHVRGVSFVENADGQRLIILHTLPLQPKIDEP